MPGDGVKLDGFFSYGGLYNPAQGVGQVQFADGTTWDRDQLAAAALASATPGNDVLRGTAGPDLFDGKGGYDLEVGNGGGDTFVFDPGYGQLEINEVDRGAAPGNVLQLGAGIDPSQVAVTGDGADILLTDGVSGDQVKLDGMQAFAFGGVQSIRFADGTAWTAQQVLAMGTTGTPGNDTLHGGPGADVFDGKGGQDLEVGYGPGDTFVFDQG